jgi:TPR repeat protein
LRNLSYESDLVGWWQLMTILAAYALVVAAIAVLAVVNIRRITVGAATARAGHPERAARSMFVGRFGEPTHATIVGVIVVALGFLLVVNRERLLHAFPAFDTVAPDTEIKTAYDAYEADDIETALRIARPLAEQDNPRAQNLLGLIYHLGRGVPRNEAEAQRWFRRSADLGDPEAPAHLARVYYDGRGVPQDFVEAAKWYRLAADRNNPRAQFNLGIMYWNGNGVSQDKVNAHLWFNLAAANFSDDPRGRAAAINNRDLVARDMTREEIAEAQKRAREWKPRQTP